MRKLSTMLGTIVLVVLMVSPAFPQSYEFDCNGDGIWDTAWSMEKGEAVTIDIWLDGYDSPSGDRLFGVLLYCHYDPRAIKFKRTPSYPHDTNHGGPFEQASSYIRKRKIGVYELSAANWDFVTVTDNKILLFTIELESIGNQGDGTITVANDLGFGSYSSGFVSNGDLNRVYPDDAHLQIEIRGEDDHSSTSSSTSTSSPPSSTTTSLSSTTSTVGPKPPPPPACITNSNCDDGLFCNGDEVCVDGLCRQGTDPCPDDAVYCNGEESCDEESDECVSDGDPCPEDEFFCNGEESCDEEADACVSSGNPCSDPTPVCNAVTDTCTGDKPAVCELSIEPESTEVTSKQTFTLTVNALGDCSDPHYEWSCDSDIGSAIDQDGNYVAGINNDLFNKVTDVVKVVEHTSGSSAEATVTVSWGCFFLALYGENSVEIEALRKFRDEVLSTTPEGQEIIRLYYEWSPEILRIVKEKKEVSEMLKAVTDGMLPLIKTSVELSEGDTSTSTMVGGHRGGTF